MSVLEQLTLAVQEAGARISSVDSSNGDLSDRSLIPTRRSNSDLDALAFDGATAGPSPSFSNNRDYAVILCTIY